MSRRKRKESHWHDGQPSGYDWISRSTRLAIYLRDDNKCTRCGAVEVLTLDHLSRDLPPKEVHKPRNLVTLCLSCNSSRRNTAREVWDPVWSEIATMQVTKPIDRAEGLRLAKERWPDRYAKKAARDAKRNERVRAARAAKAAA